MVRGGNSFRATAEVPCATSLLDHFQHRLAAHGLYPCADCGDPAVRRYAFQDCVVELRQRPGRFALALTAPSAATLAFLKDNAARYIAEADGVAADALRWSDEARQGEPPPGFQTLRLLRREQLLPGLQRFTFAADDVVALAQGGLHVRLLVPPSRERRPAWPIVGANGRLRWPEGADGLAVRVYTLRHLRPAENEVDIDVVMHGDDALAGAAADAKPGDVFGAMGPGGGGAPPLGRWLLLGGDLAALPVLARSFELLPAAAGHCVVAAPAEAAAYLSPPPDVQLEIVPQAGGPLCEQLKAVPLPAGEPVFAAFAGERADALAMRAHFRQTLQLQAPNAVAATYWRQGAMTSA